MPEKSSGGIIHWEIDDRVRHDVIAKMNIRARVEAEEFVRESQKGASFRDIHKEAISRGERYRDIIDSIIRSLNIPEGSVCADLGAGTATLASLMSLQSRVRKVYAVEISEQFVEDIMPLTFDYFGAHKEKITRVVGDFNRLEFEDGSLDFTVETGSFHHSEDIGQTMAECYRVLKPGGFLLAVERARFNIISESRKRAVLDRELSGEMKRKYGIPEGETFTREMWGEHEYSFSQWNTHLKAAGFQTKMAIIRPLALFMPVLRWLCSVGGSLFEPFHVKHRPLFMKNPGIYYELLSMPIFICTKPHERV